MLDWQTRVNLLVILFSIPVANLVLNRKIQLLIRWAQLQQKDDSVTNHYQNALSMLDSAEKDVNQFLDGI